MVDFLFCCWCFNRVSHVCMTESISFQVKWNSYHIKELINIPWRGKNEEFSSLIELLCNTLKFKIIPFSEVRFEQIFSPKSVGEFFKRIAYIFVPFKRNSFWQCMYLCFTGLPSIIILQFSDFQMCVTLTHLMVEFCWVNCGTVLYKTCIHVLITALHHTCQGKVEHLCLEWILCMPMVFCKNGQEKLTPL